MTAPSDQAARWARIDQTHPGDDFRDLYDDRDPFDRTDGPSRQDPELHR